MAVSPSTAPPEGFAIADLRRARAALMSGRALAIGFGTAITAFVVGGIGGRVAMRISAIAAPDWAQGRLTDAGARVGEITVGGTFFFIVFVGIFVAVMSTAVVGAFHELVGGPTWMRSIACGVLFAALGGSLVVNASNVDFLILSPRVLNVGLFVGLSAVFGAATIPVVERAERLTTPMVIRSNGWALPVALGLAGLGPALASLVAFSSRDICECRDPGTWISVFLGIAFVATAASWWGRIRTGRGPQLIVRGIGVSSLLAAGVAGVVRLVDQIGSIL